ncbi:MAG TPA: SLC13 family permease [Acidimicrobiales bacterium]
MSTVGDQLELLAPALAFLLAAVPLAHLLGDLGFFDAVARRVSHRVDGVWPWWLLAAATTAVLNLDTTVVLLTPLYLRIARRRGDDPMVLAVVPLLLANLASSVLPVSNLTNLIAAERFDLRAGDLLVGLGPATVAMLAVGFVTHRRWAADRMVRAPVAAGSASPVIELPAGTDGDEAGDGRALWVGGLVVAGLLVAFVLGPVVGLPAWAAVVVADVILIGVCRTVPWRSVPLATAAAVAALAAVVAVVVPGDTLGELFDRGGAQGALIGSLGAAALTAAVDNLPALLAILQGIETRDAVLPVLLGVNAGAVLTPIGSLANLLWLRTARRADLDVGWGDVLRIGLVVGAPAFLTGVAVLTLQRAL